MKNQKILIAFERSGVVRDAFLARGHDAWSCDLAASETPTNRHLQMDYREAIALDAWDLLMVAHPPCTRLCNSGVRWLHNPPPGRSKAEMWADLDAGAGLFREVMDAPVPRICVENPVMHKHAKRRIWGTGWEAACIDDGTFLRTTIQPWQFAESVDSADNVKKSTHLWLKNLEPLRRTGSLSRGTARDDIHRAPPGPGRTAFRSRFHAGVAQAMADQWSH